MSQLSEIKKAVLKALVLQELNRGRPVTAKEIARHVSTTVEFITPAEITAALRSPSLAPFVTSAPSAESQAHYTATEKGLTMYDEMHKSDRDPATCLTEIPPPPQALLPRELTKTMPCPESGLETKPDPRSYVSKKRDELFDEMRYVGREEQEVILKLLKALDVA